MTSSNFNSSGIVMGTASFSVVLFTNKVISCCLHRGLCTEVCVGMNLQNGHKSTPASGPFKIRLRTSILKTFIHN